MSSHWKSGNALTLLENGEAYFPRVFDAIRQAEREVLLETFIIFDDKVGRALHEALLAAARNGARVDVLVDGYGTADLPREYIDTLLEAGIAIHVFDPRPRRLGLRTNIFRRMHRKLVVVDGERAFVGGINYSADHLADFGPQAKQDYAVEIQGPLVADIHRFMRQAISPVRRSWWADLRRHTVPQHREGEAAAIFVTRDNGRHRNDIEQHYLAAIRSARSEILIANAYFFPGYRLLRELRNAARRGVRVGLVLQGEPDMPMVRAASKLLYDYLLSAGVEIHEYCQRPLHGKVAIVDEDWSTVGSSNLDPLSLSLNLEANVVIRDRAFNACLGESLRKLVRDHCRQVQPSPDPQRKLRKAIAGVLVYHVVRHFPALAGWLPAHKPRLTTLTPSRQAEAAPLGEPGQAPDQDPDHERHPA
jgi:Phosphatidylserine/phosphatidylglycerophosphate/cardiolipin synthases and related enzymes